MIQLSSMIAHGEQRIWHVSWSHCGNYICTCSNDKSIRIFHFKDDSFVCISKLEDVHSRTVRSCEFSPDDQLIASASFDGTVGIWESNSRNKNNWDQIASLEGHENEVKSVAWSKSGIFLATCGRDKRVWIWERLHEAEFECVTILEGHTQDVKFVKWHPTDNILYSTGYDDVIKVWEEHNEDWYCSETIQGHKSTVWGVSSNYSGDHICTCSADCSVIIWNRITIDNTPSYNKSIVLPGIHEYPIITIDWHPHLPIIASASEDNSIIITSIVNCGLPTMSTSQVCKVVAHESDVNCVRYVILVVVHSYCLILTCVYM